MSQISIIQQKSSYVFENKIVPEKWVLNKTRGELYIVLLDSLDFTASAETHSAVSSGDTSEKFHERDCLSSYFLLICDQNKYK